jgi:hypothetical protein
LDPAELATAIAEGFDRSHRDVTEVLPDLVAASEGHPQRAMLLAHLVFSAVPPGGAATAPTLRAALDAALDRVAPEARSVLDGLDFGSRRTLRAIAEYGTPISARAGRTLNLPKTTAADAAARLLRSGIVEREGDSRRWRLVDPLLGRWLRERYSTRSL